jgi:branched-subunit amino acid aminotransferase/4-amino-4-deoxychorismate lyase
VIELANKHFIPVIEGVQELSDLTDADEIFLTSAGLGVAIVTTFDFRRYSIVAGSVAAKLVDAFRKLISENK